MVSRQPDQQEDRDAERRADKARIQALEDRIKVLEETMQRRFARVDVGMGYLEDLERAAEGRIELLEGFHGVVRESLAEWEDRWTSLRASTSRIPAQPSPSPAAPVQQRLPMVVVNPTTPQSPQGQVPVSRPTTPAPPAGPAPPPPPPVQQPLPMVVVIPATPQSSQGQDRVPAPPPLASSLPSPTPSTSIPAPESGPGDTQDRGVETNGSLGVGLRSPGDIPAPQAAQVPEGTTAPGTGNAEELVRGTAAPGTGNAEDVVGNARFGGDDAKMAPATPNHRFPPTPPWRQPPVSSTDLLAPPLPEDPKPKPPRRSRSRSPAPPRSPPPPGSRRSPRLHSPAPPTAEDREVSMEVDN